MKRTTAAPSPAEPTTSRPHGPSSMLTLGASLRSESASSEATSRHRPADFGAAYAAMVNRPLVVTTQTALGVPASLSSTCTCPASGIGIKTEPRSSRASVATDGSSKSSMSNGPSSSSSSASTDVTSSGPAALSLRCLLMLYPAPRVPPPTDWHARRRIRGPRHPGSCRQARPRRMMSPRPARAVRRAAPPAGRSGLRAQS